MAQQGLETQGAKAACPHPAGRHPDRAPPAPRWQEGRKQGDLSCRETWWRWSPASQHLCLRPTRAQPRCSGGNGALGAGVGRSWGPLGTGTAPLPAQHRNAAKPRRAAASSGNTNAPARDPCTRETGGGERLTGSLWGRGKRRWSRGSVAGEQLGVPGETRPDPAPDPAGAPGLYPMVLGGHGPNLRPPSPRQHPPSRPLPTPVPSAHVRVLSAGERCPGRGGPQAEAEAPGWLFTQFICSVRVSYKQRGGRGGGGTSNGFVTSKKHGGGAGSALQLSQAGGRRGARRDGAGARPGSSLLLPPDSPSPTGA